MASRHLPLFQYAITSLGSGLMQPVGGYKGNHGAEHLHSRATMPAFSFVDYFIHMCYFFIGRRLMTQVFLQNET